MIEGPFNYLITTKGKLTPTSTVIVWRDKRYINSPLLVSRWGFKRDFVVIFLETEEIDKLYGFRVKSLK